MSSLRNLLSSKARSQSGCYTCRLRRKKCDERRPVCLGCASLEITCHFGDEKPEWMDGGPRQKEMAEFLKAQVKKQASQRRDRKYLEMLESGTRNVSLGGNDDAAKSSEGEQSTPGPSSKESPGSNATCSTAATSPPEIPWHQQLSSREDDDANDSFHGAEVHYVSIYMDYVFPHLFPHYRPHILVGGRGWILETLQSHNNKSLLHIALSLSAYYFAVMLDAGDMPTGECTHSMNRKLRNQMELALRELRKEVRSLNYVAADSRESLVVMQSILQLLIFEVATGNGDNWKVHLDAAMTLFRQILPNPGDWAESLQSLYNTTRWPPSKMGERRPWNTNQAAYRFYTANLLYVDVLSSITLGCAPRLYNYQASLIPGCSEDEWSPSSLTVGPIFMQEFRGLQNWVIQMIGDVSVLYEWKKTQSTAGALSINELMSRGKVLSDAIKGGLQVMEAACSPQDASGTVISLPLHGFKPAYPSHNLIWLNATLIYLNTVISGWQPACPEIRDAVSKTCELLYNLTDGPSLGALAFPFCISGCLAMPEDEPKYREMLSRVGGLQLFGALKEAMAIMEKVWALWPLDESWDVARCLNVLGHGVLMV